MRCAAGLALAAALAWAMTATRGAGHAALEADADTRMPLHSLPVVALTTPAHDRRPTSIPLQGLPADLSAAFEQVQDLHDYRQRLQVAAEAGDVQARWVASQVDEYCAGYAQDPQAFDTDTRAIAGLAGQAGTAMAQARARVGERCGGYSQADGVSRASIVAERRQAARGGQLAAEASLLALGEPLEASAEYRRALVQRVLDAGDPQAYLALSGALGAAASGDDAYGDLVAGTSFAELAWQLAACKLGLACGPDSVLMTRYCANGGICSRDPNQDFPAFVMDAAVPRQGADTIDTMVNRLVQSTRQGEAR
ncbi:hypothetical protein [Pseudoxanthomonas sp. X-1]|uniref:hypothetical protein n=1 Tax=Pseudoxanthomonas sp. X-1 TaxID=2571115 RepID=UPI001CC4112B|nr:hypothetical protein [Pseudoxanthomonas sp. X-1]